MPGAGFYGVVVQQQLTVRQQRLTMQPAVRPSLPQQSTNLTYRHTKFHVIIRLCGERTRSARILWTVKANGERQFTEYTIFLTCLRSEWCRLGFFESDHQTFESNNASHNCIFWGYDLKMWPIVADQTKTWVIEDLEASTCSRVDINHLRCWKQLFLRRMS